MLQNDGFDKLWIKECGKRDYFRMMGIVFFAVMPYNSEKTALL